MNFHSQKPTGSIKTLYYLAAKNNIITNKKDLITKYGISDSVVCGIGRNSYFTGTDQKTGSEYGKELWD